MSNNKQMCPKCHKIINFGEKCKCFDTKKIIAPRKENTKCFYSTRKWRKLRLEIIKRDKGLCQRCLSKGIIETKQLEIHHIKSREHYPKLEYDRDNLVTLCKTCNLQLGTSDKLDFEWENQEQEMEITLF